MSPHRTDGATTVMTCGSLSLKFPKEANVPRLNVRPGANAVDVSLSDFTGLITFEILSASISDKPVNQSNGHGSIESTLPSAGVFPGIGPTLEQSLQMRLVDAPTCSQPLPSALTVTPSRSAPRALEEQVLTQNESGTFFDEYAPSQLESGLFSASQPYATSQALPVSQAPVISQPYGTAQALQVSHAPLATQTASGLLQNPQGQPFDRSEPQSPPASQMPDSQLPDSSASQGDSHTLPPETPPLLHFETYEDNDAIESPPSSDDEDGFSATQSPTKPSNAKQKDKQGALMHPSALARVDSRLKHGKRVRFEEKPTLIAYPARKKAAVSPSKTDSTQTRDAIVAVKPPSVGTLSKSVYKIEPARTPETASPSLLPPASPSSKLHQSEKKNDEKSVDTDEKMNENVGTKKDKKDEKAEEKKTEKKNEKMNEKMNKKVTEKNEISEKVEKVPISDSPVLCSQKSDFASSPTHTQRDSQNDENAPIPQAPPVQASPWQTISIPDKERPAERWGATFTSIDEDTVLLVGGESKNEDFFRDALEYRPSAETWVNDETRPPSMPSARAWHSATRLDDIVFVFGGEEEEPRTGDRNQCNSSLVYDKTYRTWYSPSISGSPPSSRAGHCAGLVPGTRNIVIYGGIHGSRWLSDMYVLEDLCTWRKIRTTSKRCAQPTARSYASLTAVSDFLVLFGGNNMTRSFNDVFLFVPSTMTWVEPVALGRAPKPRTGHCAVASKDGRSVIIYGGWDDQGAKRLFYSDVWLLRIESQTECHWNCIYAGKNATDSPGPRAGAAMCGGLGLERNDILLFGGWYQTSYYNDITRLDVARNGLVRAQTT